MNFRELTSSESQKLLSVSAVTVTAATSAGFELQNFVLLIPIKDAHHNHHHHTPPPLSLKTWVGGETPQISQVYPLDSFLGLKLGLVWRCKTNTRMA